MALNGVNDVLVENTPVALAKHLKHEKKRFKRERKRGKEKVMLVPSAEEN